MTERKDEASKIMSSLLRPGKVTEKLHGFESYSGRICALNMEPHGNKPIRVWTEPLNGWSTAGMTAWHNRPPKNDNLNGALAPLGNPDWSEYYEFETFDALERFCAYYNLAPGEQESEAQIEELEERLEAEITKDAALSTTEKRALILARRGQGKFRQNVYSTERSCRVTGLDDAALLIASHILPWRKCQSAAQRLDGNNGLMLTPTIDRLFDRGFISFRDDGQVLVSGACSYDTLEKLGLSDVTMRSAGSFNDRQKAYLKEHRRLFGFGI